MCQLSRATCELILCADAGRAGGARAFLPPVVATVAVVVASAAPMSRYAEPSRPDLPPGLYAYDGELQLPGLAALHGRAAIEALLAPMSRTVEVESVAVKTTRLEVDGAFASRWGEYERVAGEKGKAKQTCRGRYWAPWRRDRGRWLLERPMMEPT